MARRYGKHQTEVQVDGMGHIRRGGPLDAVMRRLSGPIDIEKITVGDKDLHEGWNVAYFEDIINDEVLASADYHWTDHGD